MLEVMAAFQRDHEKLEKRSEKTSWSSTKTNGNFFTCRGVSHRVVNKGPLGMCQGAENYQADPGLSESRKASV